MLIYRVAHEVLTYEDFPSGPYHSASLPFELCQSVSWVLVKAHGDCERHLPPQWDSLLDRIEADERCGFDSLEALYKWFEGFIELLIEHGFLIYVYDVHPRDARVGQNGQAVFDMYQAKQVRTLELASA